LNHNFAAPVESTSLTLANSDNPRFSNISSEINQIIDKSLRSYHKFDKFSSSYSVLNRSDRHPNQINTHHLNKIDINVRMGDHKYNSYQKMIAIPTNLSLCYR
jgi:hypothetical protein